MVKRIVDTDFWTNREVIDNYSVEDKFFALYLMTNGKSTQVGIYSLPKKVMSFETGFTTDVIQVLLDRFEEEYGQIMYSERTQEVSLLTSLSYSVLTGGNPVKTLLERELREVEDASLILETYKAMLDYWGTSTRKFDKDIQTFFEQELSIREIAIPIVHSHNQNHNHIHNQGHSQGHNHSHSQESRVKVSRTRMNQSKNDLTTPRVDDPMSHEEIIREQDTSQTEEKIVESYIKYLKQQRPLLSEEIQMDNILSIFYRELLGKVTLEVENKLIAWSETLPKSLVLEALLRSVGKFKPISYAGTIIDKWVKHGVKNTQDVARLDREHTREYE